MFHFRNRHVRPARTAWLFAVCALVLSGCGTTKWSDTSRTGTEQLLVSNAIDRAVGDIDFGPLGDKRVYLETDAVTEVTDNKYLVKALRQHLSSSGSILCDEKEDADYIVEIRAGAIGTDRDDMLIGIPAFTLPSIPGTEFAAGTIPEIPFVKRTKQRGVAKIAAFAYNRRTGRPLWASGNNQGDSTARNLWFAGAGPLTRGSIYTESTFAGDPVPSWMANAIESKDEKHLETFADRSMIFLERPEPEVARPSKPLEPPVSPPGPLPAPPLTPPPVVAVSPLSQPPAPVYPPYPYPTPPPSAPPASGSIFDSQLIR